MPLEGYHFYASGSAKKDRTVRVIQHLCAQTAVCSHGTFSTLLRAFKQRGMDLEKNLNLISCCE